MLPIDELLQLLLHATVVLPLELRAHYLQILQQAYLSTTHVCDDVASADDFAELIQMLAGEVEELVHEAVPSSRPPNASADVDGYGNGYDSVRMDEDEFHDVEEEAAAAARMQAIVRGRADRRRALRIKWRARHTAADDDDDEEEYGLRRESFVLG